jgi:AcrR family transcriptional regulator
MKKDPARYTPRREKERLTRRAEILEAAERVFRRKGFSRASMDEVAAEAQFTKRTVYMYFADKEDLLFAVALEGSRRLFARQRTLLAAEDIGLARVKRAALAYYEFSRDFPDLFRLIEDARHLKPKRKDGQSRKEFIDFRAAMFEAYGKTFREGELMVYAVVLLLSGFIQSLSEATQSGTFGPGPDAFAGFTVDLLADALRPE